MAADITEGEEEEAEVEEEAGAEAEVSGSGECSKEEWSDGSRMEII